MRNQIIHARRWVIKIGSSLLTAHGKNLDLNLMEAIAEQIGKLLQQGHQITLVSSGAIAEGMGTLKLKQRPKQLHQLQALAAIGQMRLVHAWEQCFQKHGFHTAQMLLTHAEMSNRERYINAKSTLQTLLDMQVIPIVNENDAIANEEIRLGDNDTLAAIALTLMEADVLLMLTDQQGMFDCNPTQNPNAQLLNNLDPNDPDLEGMVDTKSGSLGSGGMLTKLRAAQQAAKAGAHTIIAHGGIKDIITQLSEGQPLGTFFMADTQPMAARKRWLLGQFKTKGQLQVDAGAAQALCAQRSLLSVGIIGCEGNFRRGDLVDVLHQDKIIARGLIHYNAFEVKRILGVTSKDIEAILGYIAQEEVIHKDNLVVL